MNRVTCIPRICARRSRPCWWRVARVRLVSWRERSRDVVWRGANYPLPLSFLRQPPTEIQHIRSRSEAKRSEANRLLKNSRRHRVVNRSVCPTDLIRRARVIDTRGRCSDDETAQHPAKRGVTRSTLLILRMTTDPDGHSKEESEFRMDNASGDSLRDALRHVGIFPFISMHIAHPIFRILHRAEKCVIMRVQFSSVSPSVIVRFRCG